MTKRTQRKFRESNPVKALMLLALSAATGPAAAVQLKESLGSGTMPLSLMKTGLA